MLALKKLMKENSRSIMNARQEEKLFNQNEECNTLMLYHFRDKLSMSNFVLFSSFKTTMRLSPVQINQKELPTAAKFSFTYKYAIKSLDHPLSKPVQGRFLKILKFHSNRQVVVPKLGTI